MPLAEFAYNNAKSTSIGHTSFELNYGYYPYVLFKDDTNPCSKSYLAEKLGKKLRDWMSICQQNLLYIQELEKQSYNKGVKPQNYMPSKKIWLNRKYIKTQ